MYNLHTEKQRRYFSEVIRLHYEEGYGEDRIAGKVTMARNSHKVQAVSVEQSQSAEIRELQKKVKELEKQLLEAEIKAEAYDELINVAEAKFRIPIRKKAGAKQ